MSLGDRLRAERERLRLSQPALAERIGVSKRSIIRWEAGEGSPAASQLHDMMPLGIDVAFILTGEHRANVQVQGDGGEFQQLGERTKTFDATIPVWAQDERETIALLRRLSKADQDAILQLIRSLAR